MRKNLGAKPYTYPQPVFILSAFDENGVPNAMNAAWGGISDDKQITMCISASHKTLKNILPYEINTLFENGDENNFAKIEKAFMSVGTKLQIRLIPFSSIGRENGLLIGFKPDSVSVFVNEKEMFSGEVTVGICNNALSDDKSFQALINPGVLS